MLLNDLIFFLLRPYRLIHIIQHGITTFNPLEHGIIRSGGQFRAHNRRLVPLRIGLPRVNRKDTLGVIRTSRRVIHITVKIIIHVTGYGNRVLIRGIGISRSQ